MQRWIDRVAVVTGASSGIGAAIAHQLQDAGLNVVALARRADRIPEAVEEARQSARERGRGRTQFVAPTPGALHARRCDASDEADILDTFKWIRQNVGRVDVLVNNAGVGATTTLTETNTASWKKILDVNILGLSIFTREAIQLMREKGVDDGHIIHIGSIGGHVLPTLPEKSMYWASKHAVRVLTEGLRKELVAAKSKIRVSEVSPGLVKTEFFKNTSMKEEDYARYPHMYPEDVADTVLYVLGAPPHVQVHELIVLPVGQIL